MTDELLLRGADDWIMAADVAWVAKSVGGANTDEEILDLAVSTIAAVAAEGLMRVGDVTDGGFFEWDLTPGEVVERVRKEWRALGRSPDLGEVCWLANTSAGDIRAEAIDGRREP